MSMIWDGMDATESSLTEDSTPRKGPRPQVIEFPGSGRKIAVLTQTALDITYAWLIRKQSQLYLAKHYGITRPEVEEVIRAVLQGHHGPYVPPSARRVVTLERMAA